MMATVGVLIGFVAYLVRNAEIKVEIYDGRTFTFDFSNVDPTVLALKEKLALEVKKAGQYQIISNDNDEPLNDEDIITTEFVKMKLDSTDKIISVTHPYSDDDIPHLIHFSMDEDWTTNVLIRKIEQESRIPANIQGLQIRQPTTRVPLCVEGDSLIDFFEDEIELIGNSFIIDGYYFDEQGIYKLPNIYNLYCKIFRLITIKQEINPAYTLTADDFQYAFRSATNLLGYHSYNFVGFYVSRTGEIRYADLWWIYTCMKDGFHLSDHFIYVAATQKYSVADIKHFLVQIMNEQNN